MDIKKALEGYQRNKAQLIIIPHKLEEIKMDLMPSCTQQLSDMPKAHSISSTVEQTVMGYEEDKDIVKTIKEKRKAEREIQVVDALISTLTHKEKQLIEMRNKQKKSWEQIAYELNYSDARSARKAHNEAVDKMEGLYEAI